MIQMKRFTVQDNNLEKDVNAFLSATPKEKIYQIDTFYSKGAGTTVIIYYEV